MDSTVVDLLTSIDSRLDALSSVVYCGGVVLVFLLGFIAGRIRS